MSPISFATHAYGYCVKSIGARPLEVRFREPIELDVARRELSPPRLAELTADRKLIDVTIYTDPAHTRHVGL